MTARIAVFSALRVDNDAAMKQKTQKSHSSTSCGSPVDVHVRGTGQHSPAISLGEYCSLDVLYHAADETSF